MNREWDDGVDVVQITVGPFAPAHPDTRHQTKPVMYDSWEKQALHRAAALREYARAKRIFRAAGFHPNDIKTSVPYRRSMFWLKHMMSATAVLLRPKLP